MARDKTIGYTIRTGEAAKGTDPISVNRFRPTQQTSVKMKMTGRIERLFAEILRVPVDTINDGSSPDNTPHWDSASAIDLTLAIEDEFNIRLTTKEITAMRSVALVKKILTGKGVADV
jgi:acyl carrier protein